MNGNEIYFCVLNHFCHFNFGAAFAGAAVDGDDLVTGLQCPVQRRRSVVKHLQKVKSQIV